MRLWSISPKYLDRQRLVACWREGLLAQSCLIKGEYTECPRCEGVGWGLIDKAKDNVGYNDCPKCKGKGKIKTPYYLHSQLERFKNLDTFLNTDRSIRAIGYYLNIIWHEASKRGYKFDFNKIKVTQSCPEFLTVTQGQLIYEFKHLQRKLEKRDSNKFYSNINKVYIIEHKKLPLRTIESHPLFKVVEGDIESWEKIK